MSALPIPPLDDERLPPQEPVHRSHWRKVLAWVLGVAALIVVFVVVGVYALLHSSRFHAYVLRTAQSKAAASLGVPVQVGEYTLTFSGVSPTLNLYNVVVHGAGANAGAPLLRVDHLEAQVQVTSLLRRAWYINEITVDHPVVHLYVDKNGHNNLPKPQSSGSEGNTNIFDLGIRHIHLADGEVYYNDRKSTLDADLHDLEFQAAFDTAQQSYSGTVAYQDGHFKYGAYNPLPHELKAGFVADRELFMLRNAILSAGASSVLLNATITDYSNPRIDASYQATLNTGELRRILRNRSLPVGIVHLSGTAQYVTDPKRPALQMANVTGKISSPSLLFRTPSFHGGLRNLTARYSLANGNAAVRDIRAGLLGGELTGTLTMSNLTGATRSRLQAALHGLSLSELRSTMSTPAMQQVNLAGSLNATADAKWGRDLADLIASTDATLQARMSSANEPTAAIPLEGIVHARYAARSQQITLARSYIRTPKTSITLDGTVSARSSLQVRMQAADLHELETVASMLRVSTPGQNAQPLSLFGTTSFTGAVTGSASAPHITGELAANNIRVRSSSWRLIRTDIDASPSRARLLNGVLQPAGRGQILFSISAGLQKWAFTPTSPIEARINGNHINVADLAHAAGVQMPVTGALAVNVAVHGTQLSPMGNGTITLSDAKISTETIHSLDLRFQGTGDQLNANLDLRMPAGTAALKAIYYPKQRAYDAQLQADGIRLDQLGAVKRRAMELTGVLNLNATGRGTIDNPQLVLSAQIPHLSVRGQKITNLNLQSNVANHVAEINLVSEAVNTNIRGHGTVNLTGNYEANLALDTQVIPLAPLVAAYAPTQAGNVTGQTELHATLRGPLKNKSAIDAHVIVPRLDLDYKNVIQLGAVTPIRVDFTNGTLQLQRAEIRGTGTNLQFQGSIPVTTKAPASLLMLGNIDLRLAQLYDPSITSSGQLRFNINSYGETTNPNVQGQINIVDAAFAGGDLPLGLQNGNGVLTLTNDRLDITSFKGQVGSGTVEASGGVLYRPSLQFDVALRGSGIRALLPQGIRTGVDTRLSLTGNMQSALLSGQVRVDQLSFTPDFDLMNIAGQVGGETAPPPSQGFSQALRLDVAVQSTNNVNLTSRTLSIQGSANLNVRGTANQPVILGRINLTGGDLIFAGNRYVLQGGTIEFVNPTRTDPVVNLGVNTTIDQYNIAMQFWGPVDHLHTTYSADPALPPADIINLIAFGKTTEASAANPTPPGALGAESLIASQVSSQLTSRVEKIAGISQLSIDPVLGGGGQSPGARIAIQQRVTSKIFVTFATDVTSTQRQAITLQYQATPRITFSGTRDQNGGFGFDTRIRKSW